MLSSFQISMNYAEQKSKGIPQNLRFAFNTLLLVIGALIGQTLRQPTPSWTLVYEVTFGSLVLVTIIIAVFKRQWLHAFIDYARRSIVWLVAQGGSFLLGVGWSIVFTASNTDGWILFTVILIFVLVMVWWAELPGTLRGKAKPQRAASSISLQTAESESRLLKLVIVLGIIVVVLLYVGSLRLDYGIFLATAIGSMSYVIVSIWEKYVTDTQLELLYDPNSPDLYDVSLTSIGNPSEEFRSLRVFVRNRGRRAARGCVGYLELLKRDPDCTMFSFGPKALQWVNIPDGQSIPRGGFATLGVIVSFKRSQTLDHSRCKKMEGNTVLTTWAHTSEMSDTPRQWRLQDAFCMGLWPLKLTVFSEDSPPVSQEFSLKVGKDWQEARLELSNHAFSFPPPPGPVKM